MGPGHRAAGVSIALAAVLALAWPAAGEPKLDSSTQLRDDVAATHAAGVAEFTVVFRMPQDSQAYLKVSPRPGNPVFANGTAKGAGWWTEVTLDGPNGNLYTGTTTGDPPMDFGTLATNTTYTLHLHAHAPAGSLAHPANYTLDYILAEHVAPAAGGGSGGTLDESVGLHAVLRVQGEASRPAGFRMPVWGWALVGVAALALVGGIVVGATRRSRGPGPQE